MIFFKVFIKCLFDEIFNYEKNYVAGKKSPIKYAWQMAKVATGDKIKFYGPFEKGDPRIDELMKE